MVSNDGFRSSFLIFVLMESESPKDIDNAPKGVAFATKIVPLVPSHDLLLFELRLDPFEPLDPFERFDFEDDLELLRERLSLSFLPLLPFLPFSLLGERPLRRSLCLLECGDLSLLAGDALPPFRCRSEHFPPSLQSPFA